MAVSFVDFFSANRHEQNLLEWHFVVLWHANDYLFFLRITREKIIDCRMLAKSNANGHIAIPQHSSVTSVAFEFGYHSMELVDNFGCIYEVRLEFVYECRFRRIRFNSLSEIDFVQLEENFSLVAIGMSI